MIEMMEAGKEWDIVVIGGGATGLGIAVDAAKRGYKTVLFEKYDFAKGTSSRSTKLVHGGVRYLAQGNIKLVKEALRERGLLLQNAPHVTRRQAFIIPSYRWWEKWFYGAGLKIYDAMSGKLGLGRTGILSKQKLIEEIPVVKKQGLSGGVLYYDGQFDDARLAINLAETAAKNGAVLLNYFRVTGLIKENKKIKGVLVEDSSSKKEYGVRGKAVINATGVFADEVLSMEDPNSHEMVVPSQGIHLVLDKEFFPSNTALMIPRTDDERVLFAVPWHNKVVVGTTDTPVEEITDEPEPLDEEVDFIIEHFNEYITSNISRKDVRSVFVGLRPLVKASNVRQTALLSRDHTILVSAGGLVTITGGKWTTYRKMAKDAVDNATFVGKLEKKPCETAELKIHGWTDQIREDDPLHYYGSDAQLIRDLIDANPSWSKKLHHQFPYSVAEVIWSVRHEMAMNIEDVLARRTRMLFLDARAAIEAAPLVAELMREELKKDENWKAEQIKSFTNLAAGYIL
jgi:glycerol-3-phosphate dehydrogenase